MIAASTVWLLFRQYCKIKEFIGLICTGQQPYCIAREHRNLQNLVYLLCFNNRRLHCQRVLKFEEFARFTAWNNTLVSLPESVKGLSNAVNVDLRNNQLNAITSGVEQWKQIILRIGRNPFVKVKVQRCLRLNECAPSNALWIVQVLSWAWLVQG